MAPAGAVWQEASLKHWGSDRRTVRRVAHLPSANKCIERPGDTGRDGEGVVEGRRGMGEIDKLACAARLDESGNTGLVHGFASLRRSGRNQMSTPMAGRKEQTE